MSGRAYQAEAQRERLAPSCLLSGARCKSSALGNSHVAPIICEIRKGLPFDQLSAQHRAICLSPQRKARAAVYIRPRRGGEVAFKLPLRSFLQIGSTCPWSQNVPAHTPARDLCAWGTRPVRKNKTNKTKRLLTLEFQSILQLGNIFPLALCLLKHECSLNFDLRSRLGFPLRGPSLSTRFKALWIKASVSSQRGPSMRSRTNDTRYSVILFTIAFTFILASHQGNDD